jgi:hypothetical protein
MNCRDYQQQIVLELYEELPEGERNALDSHVTECSECKAALDEHTSFHHVLGQDAEAWEVPADLLLESRRALANALDKVEEGAKKRKWWQIPSFSVVFTPMRMLESGALIAMGLALGVYVSQQQPMGSSSVATNIASVSNPAADAVMTTIPPNGTVSNLRIVNANSTTGDVELAGEVVQPLRLSGKMEDETVRGLLFSALTDESNPGSRLRAAEVLAQKSSGDQAIKEVLIHALVNDDNPGVRLEALKGLKAYAGEEVVRQALVHALANDQNAGIRMGAIEALTQYSTDEQVARTVQEVTKDDDNAYIRSIGLRFVGSH